MPKLHPPNSNFWRRNPEPTDHDKSVTRRVMVPPFRREGALQLDPVWREARELGVENEYGSMLGDTWDTGAMPEPRQGTWANTPDHYLRYHSSRELQFPWKYSADSLDMSPEPSQRNIENCLMDTPDCNCRWILLDSLNDLPGSGRFSYDPREADLAMLPSTNRPPGYICTGRDPRKHIRIRSASLMGFVTPMTRRSGGAGSSRTFFEPEEEEEETKVSSGSLPRPNGTGESRMMRKKEDDHAAGPADDDDEFDDVLGSLEFLSSQTFLPREIRIERQVHTEVGWNLEPEPTNIEEGPLEYERKIEASPPADRVGIMGPVTEIEDPVDIETQLRRARPGQNRLPHVDSPEAWGDLRNECQLGSQEEEQPEKKHPDPEEPGPQPLAEEEDEHMQDVIDPELRDYGEEVGAPSNWVPRSGDVIILKSCRYDIPWPGFDGKVEIYVNEDEDSKNPTGRWTCWFEEGDVIVRFGSYSTTKWQWTQAPQVRVYQYREGKIFLVARQTTQPLYPLEYKFVDPKEKAPHSIDFRLKPRRGDFIINRGIKYPFVWYVYWWDEGMPVRPSDLLVRASYDEDQKLSYCDAEVYLRNPNPDFPDMWIFLGKDDYCFTKTDEIT